MLQTSTPRIDLISFNARHAVIISAQESSAGVVYTYQFTLTLDTAAALVYDLTKLNVIIRPAAPNKTIPFDMTRMGAKAGLSILSSNEAATHADLIDAPLTPSKIPGGAIGKVARNRLSDGHKMPGFGGDFEFSKPFAPTDSNSLTLAAALSFESLYLSHLISKEVALMLSTVDRKSLGIVNYIDARVINNYKNKLSEGNVIRATNRLSRGLFAPREIAPDVNFFTGDTKVKLVKPSIPIGTQLTGGPNLQVVINNAYGYLDVSKLRTGKNTDLEYERGPGNQAKYAGTQNGTNNNITGIPKNISNFDTSQNGQPGINSILSDYKSCAMTAIFDYGLAPSMITPVNVDNTMVSIMQNYQGTSNISNNGS